MHIDLLILATGQMQFSAWNAFVDKDSTWEPDPRILGFNPAIDGWSMASFYDCSMGVTQPDLRLGKTNEILYTPKYKRGGVGDYSWFFAKEYLKKHPNHVVGIVTHNEISEPVESWIRSESETRRRIELFMSRVLKYTPHKKSADVILWYQEDHENPHVALRALKDTHGNKDTTCIVSSDPMSSVVNVDGCYTLQVQNTEEMRSVEELGVACARAYEIISNYWKSHLGTK